MRHNHTQASSYRALSAFPHPRDKESVQKGCSYNAAVATADNRALLAAGSDHKIKELEDAAVGGARRSDLAAV
jgi:hypothetical protein